jgi:hypothetical protein
MKTEKTSKPVRKGKKLGKVKTLTVMKSAKISALRRGPSVF